MKTFISIATYNEKDNIEKLIRDIFKLNINDLSIIIVDDNSPDGTGEVVQNLQREFTQLYLLSRSGKLGYGTAHIAGFKMGISHGADILISMDADFSHDPYKITELIAGINSGYEVIIGSRRVVGGAVVGWGLWRKFCSVGAMLISQIILGIKTKDLTSGYRAYNIKVFELVNLDNIKSNGYAFLEELIYLIEKSNFKIKEIPIIFHDRQLGKSKLSKQEIIKFFVMIFKIKFGQK